MTLSLAYDVATTGCQVAVYDRKADRLACRKDPRLHGQGDVLIPMIQDCLSELGSGFSDVRTLTVTTGPGSFTGVRVGLAAAHALIHAVACEGIGLTTFAAFRRSAQESSALVILETRRDDFFVSGLKGESIMSAQDLLRGYADQPQTLIGDGVLRLRNILTQDWPSSWEDKKFYSLDVSFLARQGISVSEHALFPIRAYYLRPPEISAPKIQIRVVDRFDQ